MCNNCQFLWTWFLSKPDYLCKITQCVTLHVTPHVTPHTTRHVTPQNSFLLSVVSDETTSRGRGIRGCVLSFGRILSTSCSKERAFYWSHMTNVLKRNHHLRRTTSHPPEEDNITTTEEVSISTIRRGQHHHHQGSQHQHHQRRITSQLEIQRIRMQILMKTNHPEANPPRWNPLE